MQFIQRTSRTTHKRKPLRSVLSAAAATLLLSGWASSAKADIVTENGDAGQTFNSAQFIPSSAFTTPPPANVFGDLPTATIMGGSPNNVFNDYIDLYSFNAVPGQTIQLDVDQNNNGGRNTGINGGTFDTGLALFSGNGALLAYNADAPVDPGSGLTFDRGLFGRGGGVVFASRDPFIGPYTLTYPNSNSGGTPINSTLDPNRNTYYVAVFADGTSSAAGGRIVTPTELSNLSAQGVTTSTLTRPDGMLGGTAFNYSPLGYNVDANTGGANSGPAFNIGGDDFLGAYTLQFSLGAAFTTAPVPEPGTMALMGLGIAGLAASRRRKKNKTAISAVAA